MLAPRQLAWLMHALTRACKRCCCELSRNRRHPLVSAGLSQSRLRACQPVYRRIGQVYLLEHADQPSNRSKHNIAYTSPILATRSPAQSDELYEGRQHEGIGDVPTFHANLFLSGRLQPFTICSVTLPEHLPGPAAQLPCACRPCAELAQGRNEA